MATLIGIVKPVNHQTFDQANISKPLSAIKFNSFSDGPLGFFCPGSHF
jgi:hypothetical protein